MLVFELIGGMCLSYIIANSLVVSTIKDVLAYYKIWYDSSRFIPGEHPSLYTRSLKPLDCFKCLTFWLCSYISIYNDLDLFTSVLFGSLMYIIAKQLSK